MSDQQRGAGASDFASTPPAAACSLASLPADAWGAVARAALSAEDGSIAAWVRYSLVSRAWRDGLRGEYSRVLWSVALPTCHKTASGLTVVPVTSRLECRA